ncbi:hypothetical protein BS17DRAFT_883464 [Gyrodon lividus]|nr:hypothetical protein BS17DRAFT_883464 [Gyrodon lividus]
MSFNAITQKTAALTHPRNWRKQKQDCDAEEDDNQVSEDELGAGQRKRTRTSKLATNPMLIGFYPAQCKKVLSIAKENHVDYCRELVSEALVQFRDANYNVEEGYWPDYKYPMGKLVRNYLDVHAEHGFIRVGHTIDLAKTKSEFDLLQPKLELVLGHQYHGDKLDKALESWAQEGLIGYMQRIPSDVENCKINLD